MMKQFICSALFLLPSGLSATDLDTVAVKKIALEEVTVVGFKQDKLNRSPLSVSSINGRFLRENEVRGISCSTAPDTAVVNRTKKPKVSGNRIETQSLTQQITFE